MLEHGSFKMEVTGKTLMLKPIGAWNIQTAKRCCDEYRQLVLDFKGKEWAGIVDLRDWELGTPEIWAEIDAVNAWANQHNYKYEAVVSSSGVQKALLTRSHEVLTNVDTQFFENYQDAEKWLANKGMY